jgi:two-component system sensor histidine kinase BaeS
MHAPPLPQARFALTGAPTRGRATRRAKGSITRKLFFAILAANVLIAIAVGVAMRVSFNAGFVDYVSQRETQRLKDMSELLAEAYRQHGSWDFLRGNTALWLELNAPRFPGSPAPPRPPAHPPPRPATEGDRGAPPHGDGLSLPGGALAKSGPPPPRGYPSHDAGMMSGLLDEAKSPIVGNTSLSSESVLQPVVAEGRTVGWLTGNFVSAPLRDLDRRFTEKQQDTTWAIGAFALLLSGIVALLLARGLLAPVKELAAATHRLAAGDYATRVPASSRDELGQLSEDFNRLAHALERTERMRRDFMADISHELRTPLAVLKGEIEALQDGIRASTPKTLASLSAEVATLAKLIDDLYDLSLADVGALAYRREPMTVVPALEHALTAFRERLSAHRIEIETRFPSGSSPVIDGDPTRITQLFNNLLENTVRYTDPDGTLRITAAENGDRVRIVFEDSAPGVPEELLPRLFERLFRVDASRSRASGGAGLGLSLCQSIVEAHGGEIRAAPSPLGGLAIEIALPLTRHATGSRS